MGRYVWKMSEKPGLAPGTLVHVGKRKADKAVLSIMEYDESSFSERTENIEASGEIKYEFSGAGKGINWVNLDGLHDTAFLEKLGSGFGLHPLVMEDMLNTEQRPKLEDYGDYVYIAVKVLKLAGDGKDLTTEHQNLVLGKNFVFTAGETKHNLFGPVEERLRSGSRARKMGADYLAYALLDTIVDNYFDVLESLGERIEAAEDLLMKKPARDTLQTVNDLKRDMLYVHRSVWPLREVIGLLERGDTQLVQESTRIYIRDLYDHLIQVMDTAEIYRDILSGMLDIYLSSVSNRMNEIMKVLTIISTIFIPLTFLAGIYGMNFKFMPELEWRWGYFALLGGMAALAVAMLAFFRRRKWL